MKQWPKVPLAALTLLVLGAAFAALLWYHQRYRADPTPEKVASAISKTLPTACPLGLKVRAIHKLDGADLPDGMLRAKEIDCKTPRPRPAHTVVKNVAFDYLFSSSGNAQEWMNGPEGTGRDVARHKRTVVGRGAQLAPGDWPRVLTGLGLTASTAR